MRQFTYCNLALSFLLVILFGGVGRAEPTTKVQYLMNEPVSLFDRGLDRLEKYLSVVQSPQNITSVTFIDYNWEVNRITIGRNYTSDLGGEEAKEKCILAIKVIRLGMFVIPSTGDGRATATIFDSFFEHYGYEKKGRPDNVGKELMHITRISVSVTYEKDKKVVKCEAQLLGKKISVIEPESSN